MHSFRSITLAVIFYAVGPTIVLGAPNPVDEVKTDQAVLKIHPINHASVVLEFANDTIYVDPVGGEKRYQDLPAPTLILITHLHGDHFDPATLEAIIPRKSKPTLVVPKSVAEKVPEAVKDRVELKIMANGDKILVAAGSIEAVPAYNITAGKEKFHPQGRDNGYVLSLGGKRVYFAGDTEDTPEMRALKDIDIAFLPMNQPFTMTVAKAADAIKAFKPKVVYPYHYRSGDGSKADLNELKKLVDNPAIEIRVRDWYAK